jgi:hypothetical protein
MPTHYKKNEWNGVLQFGARVLLNCIFVILHTPLIMMFIRCR